MARRLNTRNDEETRAKIQTTQLIKRLMDHVVGDVEMSTTQVRAAQILLNKSIPDLRATEHSGPDGGAILVDKIERIVRNGNPSD